MGKIRHEGEHKKIIFVIIFNHCRKQAFLYPIFRRKVSRRRLLCHCSKFYNYGPFLGRNIKFKILLWNSKKNQSFFLCSDLFGCFRRQGFLEWLWFFFAKLSLKNLRTYNRKHTVFRVLFAGKVMSNVHVLFYVPTGRKTLDHN